MGRVLDATEDTVAVRSEYESLARLLATHLAREATAVAPYANRIRMARRSAEADRADVAVVQRDLRLLWEAWETTPLSLLLVHLHQLLDELRECLDEEEREVFPLMQVLES
jgi:hypothetical protein